jgi:Protein of unknown function (DUF1460)
MIASFLALQILCSATAPESLLAKLPDAPFHKRLEEASRLLLGKPYLMGPMGEGDARLGDARPRVHLDTFDCVTYIEQSEALARSSNADNFRQILDSIRYRDGKVSWATRNHYMECGWFSSNQARVKLLSLPGEISETRTLGLRDFYSSHGIARRDSSLTLRYLPRDKAVSWLSKPECAPRIRGIGFVGKASNIFLYHTGFLLPHGNTPYLRHASQAGTVREQSASEYLQSKPKFLGIVVWEYR